MTLKWFILIGVAFFLVVLYFVYSKQKYLIFFPSSIPFKKCPVVEKLGGKIVEKKTSTETIRYYMLQTASAKATVIHFHGNGGRACDWLTNFGQEYISRSLNVFFVEYPGYAEQADLPSQEQLLRYSLAVYDDIVALSDINKVFLHGISLGSGVATYVASQRPCEGLMLDNAYPSLSRIGKLHYSFLPIDLILRYPLPAEIYAKQVTAGVLIQQGDRDEVIPLPLVKEQSKNFANLNLFKIYKGAHHNDLSNNPSYWETIENFIASSQVSKN